MKCERNVKSTIEYLKEFVNVCFSLISSPGRVTQKYRRTGSGIPGNFSYAPFLTSMGISMCLFSILFNKIA